MQHNYALILAGGGGTRLWPMSRSDKPKQMLPLIGDTSMFTTSVERLYPLFQPEQIYVSTTLQYVDGLREEAPEIPAENFVVEPSRRNNAAAIGLALTIIQSRDSQALVAMLTSDHHITKKPLFRQVLGNAFQVAQENKIVTLGIAPTEPSTAYGYIQQGELLGTSNGFPYHEAKRFTEKPDLVRATRFMGSGEYSWNSGMFIWRVDKAMAEFQRQQPEMYTLLKQLGTVVDTPDFDDKLVELWGNMPKISIDYAVMEGAEDMVVFPVDIGWSDVGSWSSLYDLLDRDSFGNCGKNSQDKRIILDTKDTLLFSDKLTVAIGVKDIVVVETDDVLMICHRDRAQEVKDVVNYLNDNDMNEYV